MLTGLVGEALGANLELATAHAQLREARARRQLAGAQLGPSSSVSLSASRSRLGRGGLAAPGGLGGGSSTRSLYSAGFDASWEADVFGGLRRGLEAAGADLEAQRENLSALQVSIAAAVALNYLDLRTAERRLEIAEATLSARSETYELAAWRLQAGLVSELDVVRARAEVESTRAALPSLHTSIVNAQNRLAVLLGRAPGELAARLGPTRTVPLAPGVMALGIPAQTLRRRPDVCAAERRLAAETARLGQAEAARYPRFELSGSVGLESLTPAGLAEGAAVVWSLLGGITAPLFDSGRIAANIEIQDARVAQALAAYRSTILVALEDVENALVALRDTGERRRALARAAESAREAEQLAEQRYSGGLVDYWAVLDSQRTLLELEDQLATSAGALASAQVQLYKALGGGWSTRPEAAAGEEAS